MSAVHRATADPTRRALLDELIATDGQILFGLCSREGRYKFHHLDTD